MTRDEVLAILKDIGPVVECPRCSYGTIKGQNTHTPNCPLLGVISWLEDEANQDLYVQSNGFEWRNPAISGWLLTS